MEQVVEDNLRQIIVNELATALGDVVGAFGVAISMQMDLDNLLFDFEQAYGNLPSRNSSGLGDIMLERALIALESELLLRRSERTCHSCPIKPKE